MIMLLLMPVLGSLIVRVTVPEKNKSITSTVERNCVCCKCFVCSTAVSDLIGLLRNFNVPFQLIDCIPADKLSHF